MNFSNVDMNFILFIYFIYYYLFFFSRFMRFTPNYFYLKKSKEKQSFYQYTCIYTSYGNGNMFIHQSRALKGGIFIKKQL